MRMCHSGVMSWAVTNTRCTSSGTVVDARAAAVLGDLLHQFVGIEAALLGHPLEHGVHFDQFGAVHDPPDEGEREKRLDAAGAAGDDGEGAGRRDGRDRGVPDRRHARLVVDAALEVRESAALPGQFLAHLPALIGDELHDLSRRACTASSEL